MLPSSKSQLVSVLLISYQVHSTEGVRLYERVAHHTNT